MGTATIRERLHSYLEVADDKKVKAIYAIMENDIEASALEYNNEIKKKLCISKNQAIDIKEVSIYNIVGQQLSTVKKVPDGDTVEIPFNLQKGVYVVKISTDKGVISKKIVK